ncbi:response regulator [Cohnella lubricantis]|uniref:Response regulator n=1 Tax=Cohnella lubricantis TaxID=2163172 RepID=A0A841T988_9BACL|nr:response regulator [Cohnella lubricantis]MBB6675810.1 response regulator [Cohnella lubricantis]MBP2120657.1 CheY-like chemotaxis protein [Cohnella lubricantis]
MSNRNRDKGKRLNELMYEKVVERYWSAGDSRVEGEPCGMVLVRCRRSFDEAIREVRARLETELGGPVETILDPGGEQAVFLPFGVPRSRTHYLALLAKQTLSAYAAGEFAVMLAEAGEQPERNPRVFEKMADLFAHLPDEPEVAFFQEERGRHGESHSVLLVDGDEEMRRYLQMRFRMKGYRVLAAEDGTQGLDLFRQEKPDVVVTDLNLTGMDGFHLLTRLQREDPDARIVVFTDNRVESSISKCFKLGVADYITRPFSPVELEARIERLLQ